MDYKKIAFRGILSIGCLVIIIPIILVTVDVMTGGIPSGESFGMMILVLFEAFFLGLFILSIALLIGNLSYAYRNNKLKFITTSLLILLIIVIPYIDFSLLTKGQNIYIELMPEKILPKTKLLANGQKSRLHVPYGEIVELSWDSSAQYCEVPSPNEHYGSITHNPPLLLEDGRNWDELGKLPPRGSVRVPTGLPAIKSAIEEQESIPIRGGKREKIVSLGGGADIFCQTSIFGIPVDRSGDHQTLSIDVYIEIKS
ncbi:MAG: hypothetical protein CEN88_261 [Candidatus Berkelbacteria bacterium Licking1014_2]|uniref:Uncharacterized protein n=1 Tax=Candidatus Berkelbacteria bacterium Licking1014_2 TaxID=2017146 RepID=A0A554LV92_9BACT|nr:MAG: hypothetical protein CEN88_261 [Candidatus Berkelbacteria bacterium Licking1014_2]